METSLLNLPVLALMYRSFPVHQLSDYGLINKPTQTLSHLCFSEGTGRAEARGCVAVEGGVPSAGRAGGSGGGPTAACAAPFTEEAEGAGRRAPPAWGSGLIRPQPLPGRGGGGAGAAAQPVPPALRGASAGGGGVSRPGAPPRAALSSARRVPPPPAFKAQFVWAGPIPGWPRGAANGGLGRGGPANGSATCRRPANGGPVF